MARTDGGQQELQTVEAPTPPPTWGPEYLDMAGVAHLLSASQKQVQRLLSAGRLPRPDLNLSGTGGPKGRRWRRDRLMEWLDARRP